MHGMAGLEAGGSLQLRLLQEPLTGPTRQRHGEHEVVVVPLTPRLVGVVRRRDVDLHPEGQEFSGDPSRSQKLLLTFKRTP